MYSKEWNNESYVKEQVLASKTGRMFLHASKRLQDKKDLVLFLIENEIQVLECVSERLKDDKDVVCASIEKNWRSLSHASERLKDDEEVIEVALNKSGWALKYASERLRDERAIVLKALRKAGMALEFTSERLRQDLAVVFEAVKQNCYAIDYASADLVLAFDKWLGEGNFEKANVINFMEQIIYKERAEKEKEILNEEVMEFFVKDLSTKSRRI